MPTFSRCWVFQSGSCLDALLIYFSILKLPTMMTFILTSNHPLPVLLLCFTCFIIFYYFSFLLAFRRTSPGPLVAAARLSTTIATACTEAEGVSQLNSR